MSLLGPITVRQLGGQLPQPSCTLRIAGVSKQLRRLGFPPLVKEPTGRDIATVREVRRYCLYARPCPVSRALRNARRKYLAGPTQETGAVPGDVGSGHPRIGCIRSTSTPNQFRDEEQIGEFRFPVRRPHVVSAPMPVQI